MKAPNLAALQIAEHDWDVFAQLEEVREGRTTDDKPLLMLKLADSGAVIDAQVREDAPAAMEAARKMPVPSHVKVRGRMNEVDGAPQFSITRLKTVVPAPNLAALAVADHDWEVFAQLRDVKDLLTSDRKKPFLVVKLADLHAEVEAKIWDDSPDAMAAARAARTRGPVRVLGCMREWKGQSQLVIEQFEVVDPAKAPKGFDPDQFIDPALARVEDLCCNTLVFDIETVPALDRRDLPPDIAEALTAYTMRKSEPDVVDAESKKFMGMSPFFGKVVSLAIGDGDAEPGEEAVTVLAVPPDGTTIENCPPWLRPMSEADLLRSFWALASRAETVVSFNGRGFDVPFLVTRSLIHGIPARVDLMSQRWSLRPHLDLFELLTQRNRGPSSLNVVCWALGIESPKEVMDGSMVAPAYARGEIVKIAEYNSHDVRATSAIYRKVRDLVLRYRSDWSPPSSSST